MRLQLTESDISFGIHKMYAESKFGWSDVILSRHEPQRMASSHGSNLLAEGFGSSETALSTSLFLYDTISLHVA
jgi:hypothetical protein